MEKDCETCQLVAHRDRNEAPDWDAIHRTAHFDVVHSFNSTLLGWLVVVCRRHVESVADLSEEASSELGQLCRRLSQILQELTGCERTYLMQFGEAVGHNHLHIHIVPRLADIPDELKGAGVFGYLGADEASRVSEESMNGLADAIRQKLQT